MKKLFGLIMSLLLLISCSATNSKSIYEFKRDEYLENQKDVKVNDVDIKNNQKFSIETLKHLQKDGNSNLLFSPISYYMALSLLAPISKDQTQSELFKMLKVDSESKLESLNQRLKSDLEFHDDKNVTEINNSLWLQENEKFNIELLKQMGKRYQASLFETNFKNPKSAQKVMNDWISTATHNFLKEVQSTCTEDTVLAIINTIYFKDTWQQEFEKMNNVTLDFKAPTETKKTEFMSQEVSGHSYVKDKQFVSISKSFKNGYKMMFIMPEVMSKDNPLDQYLKIIDNYQAQNVDVDLFVPKFDISAKLDLIEMTKKLGLASVFNEKTSQLYPYLNDQNVYVSNIIQQVRFKIDEQGVEAAAYTEITMDAKSAPITKERVELKLDKPFYFLLTNEKGIVTFIGVITDPTLNN